MGLVLFLSGLTVFLPYNYTSSDAPDAEWQHNWRQSGFTKSHAIYGYRTPLPADSSIRLILFREILVHHTQLIDKRLIQQMRVDLAGRA